MKPLTSLLIVGLAFGATICAEECTQQKMQAIASNSHLQGCISKVGFANMLSISALTGEQIKAMCDSSDCMALVNDVRTILVDDCSVQGTTIMLIKDLLDPFGKACSSNGPVDSLSSSVDEISVGSTASGSSLTSVSAAVLPASLVYAVALIVATLALQ